MRNIAAKYTALGAYNLLARKMNLLPIFRGVSSFPHRQLQYICYASARIQIININMAADACRLNYAFPTDNIVRIAVICGEVPSDWMKCRKHFLKCAIQTKAGKLHICMKIEKIGMIQDLKTLGLYLARGAIEHAVQNQPCVQPKLE